MVVTSAFFFSGCVVPADGYYSDPYYPPSATVVPTLPHIITLHDRPYYTYRGYYYFYNNSGWYYSKHRNGRWIVLPRKHWPRETRWKGRHYYHDHRDKKYKKPHSKDPKDHSKKDPRKDNSYKKDHHKEQERLHKKMPQKEKRRHDMNKREEHKSLKKKQERRNQDNVHTNKNSRRDKGKKHDDAEEKNRELPPFEHLLHP